ncbi:MAG: alcohol acetyltransferase [Linnemannia gamsii]|nr:MAG: alcohol acetyltransferase [Linnemannia gamsii]
MEEQVISFFSPLFTPFHSFSFSFFCLLLHSFPCLSFAFHSFFNTPLNVHTVMTLQVVRPVDNLERYNVTRSNVNIYNNVSVGVSIHSPVTTLSSYQSQDYWAKLLLNPIISLLDRHPILATVVGDHLTGHPVFLRLRSIDLLSLIRVVSSPIDVDRSGSYDAVMSRVLEDEHNKPFDLADQSTPLWRLVIVPTGQDAFHLIYTFHHVIGDGRSAMTLSEQIVEQLNIHHTSASSSSSSSSSSTFNIPILSDKPIPASIESRVNCYPSIGFLLWEATRSIFLPGFLKKALETKYWAGEIDSSLEAPNQTEVGLLRLTQDETRAVVQLAKARATTVQAIMYTASIFAARAIFILGNRSHASEGRRMEGKASDNIDGEEALVFATPCSLRNLISDPIGADEQGNYVSEILHNNIRVQDGSGFWFMTDQYRKEVVAGTTTTRGVRHLLEHFGALALLSKKDGAWESFMTSRVTKDQHGRKASIKLSNLGRGWDTPSTAAIAGANGGAMYTIQDGFFSQSSGVTASALTMSAATANGRLSISTTWQTAGFHGRERGEAFVAEFKRILLLVALQHADTPELSYLEICPQQ